VALSITIVAPLLALVILAVIGLEKKVPAEP
jgi:hypothetical protein